MGHVRYVRCASTVREYENQQADFICELAEQNDTIEKRSGWDYLGCD